MCRGDPLEHRHGFCRLLAEELKLVRLHRVSYRSRDGVGSPVIAALFAERKGRLEVAGLHALLLRGGGNVLVIGSRSDRSQYDHDSGGHARSFMTRWRRLIAVSFLRATDLF